MKLKSFRCCNINNNLLIILILGNMGLLSCSHDGFVEKTDKSEKTTNVLFLHHSTGNRIYNGIRINGKPMIENWFNEYNKSTDSKINFKENIFPSSKKFKVFGYGWKNYPYDYYNIWVKNGNHKQYKNEPTLKLLTSLWDVIIIKHCYPVSNIIEDDDQNINSSKKTLENYKLQYEALKQKFHEYPNTKFILWTGAALTEKKTNKKSAEKAREFFSWVKNEWDSSNDNIYIFDFYELETEGGLYLKDNYSTSPLNSHPNDSFSEKVALLFCKRIVDVILHDGAKTTLKGTSN